GSRDCYVTKMDANGKNLVYSTYLGGFDLENAVDIVIDSDNQAIVVGWTRSTNFPTTNGSMKPSMTGDSDVFLTKVSQNGTELIYSSFIGGDSNDAVSGMSICENDCIVTIGKTFSNDFPKTDGTYSSSDGRIPGDYIMKLDIDPPSILFDPAGLAPTTGESLDLVVNVSDNLEVSLVWCDVRYPNGTLIGEHALDLADGDHASGNWSCSIPFGLYYAGPVLLTIHANDTVLNGFTIPDIRLDVIDNDPPTLELDPNGPASTGEPLTLSLNVTDNIGVGQVHVVYWYGDAWQDRVNLTMDAHNVSDNGNGTFRSLGLTIPIDVLGPIHYFFAARDMTWNWNVTEIFTSDVMDLTKPILSDINIDTLVVKGWDLGVSLRALDNFGIDWVDVELISADGRSWVTRLEVSPTEVDIYMGSIPVPRDIKGPAYLVFQAIDVSGNAYATERMPINPINYPPHFEEVPLWEVTEGVDNTLDLSKYMVDSNDPLESLRLWTAAPGVRVEGTTIVAHYDEWVEDHSIEVGVSDGEDASVVNIDVTLVNVNDPPAVDSLPPDRAYVETEYVYDLEVTDVDPDDIITFSLASGPSGALVDEWGRLTWTPEEADVGTVTVNVSVSDGTVMVHHEWEVEVRLKNRPPKFTSSPPDEAAAGTEYRWAIEALDPDGDTLRFTLIEGPAEASIVEGALLWSPEPDFKDKVVTVAFTVEVSDGEFDVTMDFSVALTYPPNRPPVILGELQDIVLSREVTIDLTEHMSDPDDPLSDLTWHVVGGDASLVASRIDGNVLSIRPVGDASGDVDLEIILEDDDGLRDSVMLHVDVLGSGNGYSLWIIVLVVAVLASVAGLLLYQRHIKNDGDI
ncbi:MAG: hypothetical protein KAJ35_04500, partial [Thermoplasmata archaeon]|nr:hypothetical protein [Thermoplasmata archaeon]